MTVLRARVHHRARESLIRGAGLAVLLLLLELDELEVVFRDDEARADGADAVRLQLAHRVLERLARVVLVLRDVGASGRSGLESHVGLPHGRGILAAAPRRRQSAGLTP